MRSCKKEESLENTLTIYLTAQLLFAHFEIVACPLYITKFPAYFTSLTVTWNLQANPMHGYCSVPEHNNHKLKIIHRIWHRICQRCKYHRDQNMANNNHKSETPYTKLCIFLRNFQWGHPLKDVTSWKPYRKWQVSKWWLIFIIYHMKKDWKFLNYVD